MNFSIDLDRSEILNYCCIKTTYSMELKFIGGYLAGQWEPIYQFSEHSKFSQKSYNIKF